MKIFDGSTGEEFYSQDEEVIQGVVALISQLQLRTYRSNDERDGTKYHIVFFAGNQKICSVTPMGDILYLDGDVYTVLNPEICEQLEELLMKRFS